MAKKYVIDASTLISASRQLYPFDIAPAFWRQLIDKGGKRLIIIDRVRDEILNNEDQLSQWLSKNMDMFSLRSSQDLAIIENYRQIISFVNSHPRYRENAKRTFATEADSWLCAHALAYSYVVVTEEKYEPNSRSNVKIPNICEEFGISYMNQFQFIRAIGIRFD